MCHAHLKGYAMISVQRIVCLAFAFLAVTAVARADTVTLVSNRDTTIYQGNTSNSDGAGQAMFVGNTNVPTACRGLIGFDIAANIPAGSTITGVQLSLVSVLAAPGPATTPIELHRLLADWGEGSAGRGSGASHGGQGFSTAADGTATTWTHQFYKTTPWTNRGGDFAATASGSTTVGSANMAYISDSNSNPGMVEDVQSWLDNPSSNFGWLLLGDESKKATARVFSTREAQTHGAAPALVVTFTPASPTTPQLVVSAPPGTTAGSPFQITVSATDSSGQVVAGYTGTVTFTASDPFPGVLPANYTFTSNDQGTHSFDGVTLFTAGAQTLTAQDTADSTIMGSATVAVAAAPADHLQITASQDAVSGMPFDVTLAAVDSFGNVDMSYAGTVTWTSSDTDPGVILPADYTFQASDSGMHIFSAGVTLITVGDQALTATDTVSGITGSATVTVGPGP
jgi:hypothetical protein